MPAFLLLFRAGRFVVPVPWFLVWLPLIVPVPLMLAISPFFSGRKYGFLMRNAHRLWWMIVALHGLKVDIRSKSGDGMYLSFL
jgi:hypothetical protein